MKLTSIIVFSTLWFTSLGQVNDVDYNFYKLHILYVGMDNPVILSDSTLQNPVLKSKSADIIKKDKLFLISLKDTAKVVVIDIYDVIKNDTVKIRAEEFQSKRIPYPQFYIEGKLIENSISKSALLKQNKIVVSLGDEWLDKYIPFKLISFDLEIDGKLFHSNSNSLTSSMTYWINNSKSNSIRISNDMVTMGKATRTIYTNKLFQLEK